MPRESVYTDADIWYANQTRQPLYLFRYPQTVTLRARRIDDTWWSQRI